MKRISTAFLLFGVLELEFFLAKGKALRFLSRDFSLMDGFAHNFIALAYINIIFD